VNDVRRETAGSYRFPVNFGDHIQNRFLCQFPTTFPPIPALGNGDRILRVWGWVSECRSDCFLRSQDTWVYPAVYGFQILWQSIILGSRSHALTLARHMPILGDISWFLDLLVYLTVLSQFLQLKSLFSPSEKFIQSTGNTSKQRKTWKTIEIQQRPIQSIRKT
jgi:hypothetical protein